MWMQQHLLLWYAKNQREYNFNDCISVSVFKMIQPMKIYFDICYSWSICGYVVPITIPSYKRYATFVLECI